MAASQVSVTNGSRLEGHQSSSLEQKVKIHKKIKLKNSVSKYVGLISDTKARVSSGNFLSNNENLLPLKQPTKERTKVASSQILALGVTIGCSNEGVRDPPWKTFQKPHLSSFHTFPLHIRCILRWWWCCCCIAHICLTRDSPTELCINLLVNRIFNCLIQCCVKFESAYRNETAYSEINGGKRIRTIFTRCNFHSIFALFFVHFKLGFLWLKLIVGKSVVSYV